MSEAQQELGRKVRDAISEITNEPEQIDAIAKIRHHYRIEDNSKYYPLVQEYLNGDFDLSEAIYRLFTPIYKGIHKFNGSELQFFDLWNSILHSAMRIPFQDAETHERLVAFIGEYKKQPHPPRMYDGHGSGGIFGSLYGFTYTVQRYWNDVPGHGSGSTAPEIHAWANLNYFWACLTRDDVCDLSLRCISAMRGALEDDQKKKNVFQQFTTTQLYDSLVPAAAVWVFAFRGRLYEKEKNLTPTHPKMPNYARGGALYDGPCSFNKGRWRLWKERFGVISQMHFLMEETRELAKQAFDIMEQSEPTVRQPRYELRSRQKKSTASDK